MLTAVRGTATSFEDFVIELRADPTNDRDLFFVEIDAHDAGGESDLRRPIRVKPHIQHRPFNSFSLARSFTDDQRTFILDAHVVVHDALDERSRESRGGAFERVAATAVAFLLQPDVDVHFCEEAIAEGGAMRAGLGKGERGFPLGGAARGGRALLWTCLGGPAP